MCALRIASPVPFTDGCVPGHYSANPKSRSSPLMQELDHRAFNEDTPNDYEVGEENAGGLLFSQRVFLKKSEELCIDARRLKRRLVSVYLKKVERAMWKDR
jgi:hypothetical protein